MIKERLERLHALSMQMEDILSDLGTVEGGELLEDIQTDIETLTCDIQDTIDSLGEDADAT